MHGLQNLQENYFGNVSFASERSKKFDDKNITSEGESKRKNVSDKDVEGNIQNS